MDEVRDWLELSLVPGIGPKTFFKLLGYFGSARNALEAPSSELKRVPELGAAVIEAIRLGCKSELDKTLEHIDRHDVTVVTFNDPAYPQRLGNIHDPPPLLYVKGAICPAD
ncbi:MAG: DNA-protecting protein DprA, partial [Candidatus Hydrogenedentota bacterium]